MNRHTPVYASFFDVYETEVWGQTTWPFLLHTLMINSAFTGSYSLTIDTEVRLKKIVCFL